MTLITSLCGRGHLLYRRTIKHSSLPAAIPHHYPLPSTVRLSRKKYFSYIVIVCVRWGNPTSSFFSFFIQLVLLNRSAIYVLYPGSANLTV